MEFEATEDVEKTVIDFLIHMLRLGAYIHKLGKVILLFNVNNSGI